MRGESGRTDRPGETRLLRIIQNRSAAGAASYYSHAEYYGEGQEKAGLWGGKAAERLGLTGPIAENDFKALCENRHPVTGERLTARQGENRTVGYDFNWHVPKGVSLAYAVGGDDRIAEVFDRAVGETMAEIEAEAATRVRVGGRHEDRTTGNLAWGRFLHTTARPDGRGAVDPHLHAHCFVFNVTRDPVENRYKAAQFRELKRDAGYFEARMHARLAKAMHEELGYAIKREGRQWDVAGLGPELKRKFSRRTAEIEALANEKGVTDADEKAELGAATRNTKSNKQTLPELRAGWRARLTPEETDAVDRLRTEPAVPGTNLPTLEAAVRQAIEHSFERESVVPERRVLAEALRLGAGTVDVDAVSGEAERQGLRTRTLDGRRLSTTPAVLADERAVLDFAKAGRGAVTPLNADWRPAPDSFLSEEQTNAVRHLATGRDRLQLLLGGAGTGKTTLMTAAVAAIEAGGRQVFTFAPSAEASRKVLRDEGFSNATTVAELLVNKELQAETAGQVLWIDEASLLGTRQLRRVTDLAARNGSRLILSGDWKRQHGSVTRGGVLGLLDRYAGVTPVEIGTIRRQRGKYKEAIGKIAEGDVLGGFDRLDALGWVRELPDGEREQAVARDYADAVGKQRSAMVLSPTHAEARGLTAAIRTELKGRGLIDGEERNVRTLIPRHLTAAEKADPAFLRDGDVVVFQQHAKGYRKGERVAIDGAPPPELVAQATRFAVFRPATLPLAAGDRIRLAAGGRTADGAHRLNNGGVFTLAGFTDAGDLKLSNGWTLPADYGHLAHGFVSTSHASQGRTVDHVFVAESSESFGAAGREQFYVSASRGRKSATVYTDEKDALREAIRRSSAKVAASDLFGRAGEGEKLKLVVDRERRHKCQREAATVVSTNEKRKEYAHAI